MKSRKRVIKALNWQVPDRVPLDGWFLNSVIEKLKQKTGENNIEDILKKLGIDFRTTCMLPEEKFRKDSAYFNKLGLSIQIGDYYVKKITCDEYEDEWGVRIKVTGGEDLNWKYSYHPLNENGVLSLKNLKLPDLSSPGRFDKVVEDVKEYGDEYMVAAGVSTLFRKGWILSGFSRFLEALYTDREFVNDLLNILTDFYTEQVKRYIECGVDIIEFGGDLGTEESLMLSPALWREIFKPRFKKIVQQTKKQGVYFFLHSDGNIEPLIPDLIEVGINIINPIQPECMVPEDIKKKYGKDIILHGTMSLQRTFSSGNKEDIKNEVFNRIERCGYNGGLILSPSNAFTEDIPIDNIIYFYKLVQETKLS